jgi:hypothetical protein
LIYLVEMLFGVYTYPCDASRFSYLIK